MKTNAIRLLIVAASVLLAGSEALAAGGNRIAIAGIRKDDGKVTKQLTATLCGAFECVPASRVKRGGTINFAAARSADVSGVIFGTVATVKGKKRLELALLVSSLKPKRRWVFPLQGGRVSRGDLDRLSSDLESALGSGGRAPPPQAYAPVAPPPPPPPAPAAPSPAPVDEPPAPEVGGEPAELDAKTTAMSDGPATPTSSSRRTPPQSPISSPDEAPRGRLAAVDVGLDITQRKLSYSGVSPATNTLQTFSVGSIVSPALGIEVSPWGSTPERTLAGLTLLGTYARSVGLTAEAADAPGVKHDTVLQRVSIGAGWRLHPFAPTGLSVMPRVAWRMLSLKVGAKNGARIAGLPDANLSGASIGLDLDYPLTQRFALLGGIGYTAWTQAKDLVGTGTGFFPSGSAWALDANVGLSVDVAGPISVRVLGDYSSTIYKLQGASTYTASGAMDRYLGGRVMARFVF